MDKKDAVINVANVTKTFKKQLFRRGNRALDDLSFDVSPGEIFGIIGPNGAGKSTSIKILLGFIRHDSGMVSIEDKPPTDPSSHENLGYLPENPCLYDQLTITEHLQFAGHISSYSSRKTKERITELLDKVNLSHVAKVPIRRFSKGMTQRAALAYALFNEPSLLILDEPMSGLDPLGRQLVIDILRDYNRKGNTVLFCSHILTDVERICDRIAIMHKGKLAAVIKPETLLSEPQVEKGDKTPLEEFFLSTVNETNP